MLAAQIPVLAGAEVVQKALIIPLEHNAHVGDPGVDHAAEDEIHQTVAPPEGADDEIVGGVREFRGKMEALAGVRSYLEGIRQKHVVLLLRMKSTRR